MSASTCRKTPAELDVQFQPRGPVTDPTLGIAVRARPRDGVPANRLVAIGDSLTQGFMSAAIFRTDLSWPAMLAYELGLDPAGFRFPTYEPPTGPGGLPLDLERLARAFGRRFGDRLQFSQAISAGLWLRSYLDRIEDYWERGPGSQPAPAGDPFHNMAVYGWDVLDAVLLNARTVSERIDKPRDNPFAQLVSDDGERAGLVVLQRSRDGRGARTVFQTAASMARSGGIETLVVMLGANNALGSVVSLQPCWTPPEYEAMPASKRLKEKSAYTVWRPAAFALDWADLVAELRRIDAQHVVVATVPAVTIAPIARGVGGKLTPGSRYFPYYTRPWIDDDDFNPGRDPHITGDEARAIDSAINGYNATIIDSVRAARTDGLDWYLFDMAALLDRLASRRYVESPWARPSWWTPYQLPPELLALDPVPNTHFYRSDQSGRTDGGLFSLDGVHPTTIGYGIIAQEVIKVMELAGVKFADRGGSPRTGPITVDWRRIIETDSLISNPPPSIASTLNLLGWFDQNLDWVRQALPFGRQPALRP